MVDLTTWTGILVFAGTAGLITAAFNQVLGIGKEVWLSRSKRQSEGGYLALRLAAILEGYAYDCASFIGDNANAPHDPEEQYPAWKTELPNLPPFPEETTAWHSIDLKLAGRVLDLRNHLAGSQGMIDSTAEFAQYDLGDELDAQAAARGHEAWSLAKDLRYRYGLPCFVPVWDFTETLESALQRAKKAKEEAAARHAEMLRELESDDIRAEI